MHLTLTYLVQSGGRFFTKSNVRGYCFGFNGQMKDNEVYGEGNSYTAEYWQYDPRLGRRWNIDPVDQVSISNYACFRNNPIYFVDIKGNFNTKAGAWLYRLFHGKKGDQIYKKDGSDIWVIGRQSEESHQQKFINEMTGEQTVLTTISVQEITKWNNEKAVKTLRGGQFIYKSDGSARTIGPSDYGDPSGMIDFSELQGLFGAWGPDESALKYAAKWIGKINKSPDTQDLITLLKIFDTVKGKADRGEAIGEAISGIKKDYDMSKRMEKYNEPDSIPLLSWPREDGTSDTIGKVPIRPETPSNVKAYIYNSSDVVTDEK